MIISEISRVCCPIYFRYWYDPVGFSISASAIFCVDSCFIQAIWAICMIGVYEIIIFMVIYNSRVIVRRRMRGEVLERVSFFISAQFLYLCSIRI